MALLDTIRSLVGITKQEADDIPAPTVTLPTDGVGVLGTEAHPVYTVALPVAGNAGGDLSGTYPDPAIKASALSADAGGRAKLANAFFNAATVALKFAADSFTNANLLQLIADGAFTADSATRALFANGFLPAVKSTMTISTEQTGTGNPQNVAHNLGYTPTKVWVTITESDGSAFDIAEGSHDGTNCVVTVTSGVKFKVAAW